MKGHYLFPGKLAAFKEETIISTLLGSCVAVAIHDPVALVGGLNHFLLPEGSEDERENARYGVHAIPLLIEECVRLGAQRGRLQAKVYGGGNVINVSQSGESIGARNIELAEQILKKYGIPILERHVAGESARTIKMNTTTFEIFLNSSSSKENGVFKPVDVSGFKPLPSVKGVKVLIVDDSATVRKLFTSIFEKHGLEVVGTAADPYQARDLIVNKKPDVITLDIEMPKMSGVVFLEKLMKHHPVPVVMVSSLSSTGNQALKALDLGAIEFVHKPSQYDPDALTNLAATLINKVRAAASVKVLQKNREVPDSFDIQTALPSSARQKSAEELKLVVIGGNAGSSEPLEKIARGYPSPNAAPVVIACSTVSGFLTAFISKLKSVSKAALLVVREDMVLQPGNIYFIPADFHGKIQTTPQGPKLILYKAPPVCAQLPSSTILFQSAAQSYAQGVCAILLSGFGADGIEGLIDVQKKGGTTVVQHPKEAQFPYAPQKAVEMGIADEILNVEAIAIYLQQLQSKRKKTA